MSGVLRMSEPHDPINHPDHYTVGGIETIDVMKAKSSYEEFIGHLRLTAMKYIERGPFKENALKDYKKAVWYLNRLIKEIEEHKPDLPITSCPSAFGQQYNSNGGWYAYPHQTIPMQLSPEQLKELQIQIKNS